MRRFQTKNWICVTLCYDALCIPVDKNVFPQCHFDVPQIFSRRIASVHKYMIVSPRYLLPANDTLSSPFTMRLTVLVASFCCIGTENAPLAPQTKNYSC